MARYESQRSFLKSNFKEFKKIQTDKSKGLPPPPASKPVPAGAERIDLPPVTADLLADDSLLRCISRRRSTRFYSQEKALSLGELSYLLWATQGVSGKSPSGMALRTVPCSGASYTFETYLILRAVTGLRQGVYRYLPAEHQLVFLFESGEMESKIDAFTLEQPYVPNFAKKAAALFVWSTTPYRSEWKFDIAAHKKILIDAGHICQNLYLAGESVGAGTCAIGIYDQQLLDSFLGLDGEEEFVIYLAAVGKKLADPLPQR